MERRGGEGRGKADSRKQARDSGTDEPAREISSALFDCLSLEVTVKIDS